MLNNPDKIWREIEKISGKDKELNNDLQVAIYKNITASKLNVIIKYVEQLAHGDKSVRILDYGCGGGQLLTYLRILGYKNLTGVDVRGDSIMRKINVLHNNIGFETDIFFNYDGVQLPFSDESFDIIISQQVIEHVNNIDNYFSECKRVLSPHGEMFLDFPHRLVPFDTHTKMWFIHYFPSLIRSLIYDKYISNGAGNMYANFLYLRPIWFYIKILNQKFSCVLDMTGDRISNFEYQDHYEGNISVRVFIDKLVNLTFFGIIFKKIIALFSNATLIVKK